MTPIRPSALPPQLQPGAAPAQDAARLAAQRAFFAAALGQAQPAAAPGAPATGDSAPGAQATAAPAETQKIPRPGSLLDIRI